MKVLMLKGFSGIIAALLSINLFAGFSGASSGRRVVRIGHVQPMNHPVHLALEEFKDYVESRLGDKYDIEIYPSELLGSQVDMVQLTQTGAIDFCVASNSILETFSDEYSLFNLPYLFRSPEAYRDSMNDAEIMDPIFNSTNSAGFKTVAWFDAGARNFYTVDREINSPEDLKGLKIRVQQGLTNVAMMKAFGGSATPMSFGDVYTALQASIIDGAENNVLALTDNGHGDVCKYYSYDMHQMIPDLMIGNVNFLDSLDEEDRKVFEEGFELVNSVECELWDEAVDEAIDKAVNEQGVTFSYPDITEFIEVCKPLHEELLSHKEELRPIYEKIQSHNKDYSRVN